MRVSHRRYFIGVELQGDLLRHAAAIGEEQRRAVGVYHVAEGVGERVPTPSGRCRRPSERLSGKRTRKSMRLSAAESTMPTCRAWPCASRPPHSWPLLRAGGRWPIGQRVGTRPPPLPSAPSPSAVAPPRRFSTHGMDLIQDHGFHRGERLPTTHRGEQQIQALGRGDEHFRRAPQHALPLAGVGIAAAGLHAQIRKLGPCRRESRSNSGNRLGEIDADVVVQRLQGRYVENARMHPGTDLPVAKASMAHRNAVRVLPLPVGAVISRCSPAAMRGSYAAGYP